LRKQRPLLYAFMVCDADTTLPAYAYMEVSLYHFKARLNLWIYHLLRYALMLTKGKKE
jgi:hypothetical protein